MALRQIDVDTPQPNGRFGEPTRSGNIKINANTTETEARLQALESGATGTGTRLDDEIATRAAADSALGDRIDAEHSLITQETADRTAAVLVEATARQSADTALSARIIGDNVIINGAMDVWQRGTSFASAADARRFTADRWIAWTGGGKACEVGARSTHDAAWIPALNQVRPTTALYYAVSEAGTAAGSFALLQQNIEGVGTLAGGPVAVSFVMWVDKATKIGVGFWQSYDDGADVVVVDPSIVTLVPGWQVVETVVQLPAISATRARGGRNCLNLNIWLAASNSPTSGAPGIGLEGFQLWITNVKVERGNKATAYSPRTWGEEIAMCQRFFCKSYNLNTPPGSNTNEGRQTSGNSKVVGGNGRMVVAYPSRMRAIPTVTLYGAPTGPAGTVSEASGSNITGAVEAIGSYSFNAAWSNSAPQWGAWFHYTADAEI